MKDESAEVARLARDNERLRRELALREDREQRRLGDLSLINELGSLLVQHLDLSAVLSASVQSSARIVEVPHAFLLLHDGEAHLRLAATVVGRDATPHEELVLALDEPSAAAHAMLTRKPVVIHDIDDPRLNAGLARRFAHVALLAVPLIARGEPIGSMVFGDTRRGRRFTATEIDRAGVISNQLATGIANARLFDDLRRSYDELGKAQQALVERERLAAIGELAARVAHEVRNPLAVLWNSLVSLRRLIRPSGDVSLLLDIVDEESGRLNEIVGDLLDFARPHEPVLREASLDCLVVGALDSVRAVGLPVGLELAWEPACALPTMVVDARWLHQALVNLLTNATQAMPKGGTVTVRAGVERDGPSEHVWLDVTDVGSGIPVEHVAQVFQPFFTTRATGTGLGLAVVKRIVEAHAGNVAVASSSDDGTTIRVTLPIRVS